MVVITCLGCGVLFDDEIKELSAYKTYEGSGYSVCASKCPCCERVQLKDSESLWRFTGEELKKEFGEYHE